MAFLLFVGCVLALVGVNFEKYLIRREVGFDSRFFLPGELGVGNSLVDNPQFAKQFYSGPNFPRPVPTVITAKGERKRVIVFGSDEARGDPEPGLSFSEFLRGRLIGLDLEVDIINTAVGGLDSNAVLEVTEQCRSLEGDVWVIYLGSGERFDPFRISAMSRWRRTLLSYSLGAKALRSVEKTRTGQVMLSRFAAPDPDHLTPSLPGNGTNYRLRNSVGDRDYLQLQSNLARMIQMGTQSGAEVIVCTIGMIPPADQLSETLTVDFGRLNDVIRKTVLNSGLAGVILLDLENELKMLGSEGGGLETLFIDQSRFSPRGNKLVADAILKNSPILQSLPKGSLDSFRLHPFDWALEIDLLVADETAWFENSTKEKIISELHQMEGLNLSLVMMDMVARRLGQVGEYKESQKLWTRLVKLMPHRAEPSCYLGERLLQEENYVGAVANFRNALSVDPHCVPAIRGLAEVNFAQNQLSAARNEVMRVRSLDPNSGSTFELLGRLFRKEGQNDPAIVQFRRAIEIDPSLVASRLTLSEILEERQFLTEAEKLLTEVLAIDPEHSIALARMEKLDEKQSAENFGSSAND